MNYVYKQHKTLKEKQATLDSVQQTHMMRLKTKLPVISYVYGPILPEEM